MDKRLYRSRTNSTIAGVCGGLGEYFGIDPVFLRIIAVLLVFADGISLLGYLICWLVIPKRPLSVAEVKGSADEKSEFVSWNRFIPGGILIVLGLIFIINEHYWWWHIERLWPLLLIGLGLVLVIRVGMSSSRENNHEPSQI